jgi:hypothetical protein
MNSMTTTDYLRRVEGNGPTAGPTFTSSAFNEL